MSIKILREVAIWGTVVSFDVRDFHVRGLDEAVINAALHEAEDWLVEVDNKFSTYKPESLTCQFRRGTPVNDADFEQVLAACQDLKEKTNGAFDPWLAPGGFDPSGFVKGWATDRAARLLAKCGLSHFQINAGGDVVVRGGRDIGEPWRIGIVNPHQVDQALTTVAITSGCIASSGHYERGPHIVGATVDGASVVGPDAGIADALSTALMVTGPQGLSLIAQWQGYSGMVIHGSQMTMCGPAFV